MSVLDKLNIVMEHEAEGIRKFDGWEYTTYRLYVSNKFDGTSEELIYQTGRNHKPTIKEAVQELLYQAHNTTLKHLIVACGWSYIDAEKLVNEAESDREAFNNLLTKGEQMKLLAGYEG